MNYIVANKSRLVSFPSRKRLWAPPCEMRAVSVGRRKLLFCALDFPQRGLEIYNLNKTRSSPVLCGGAIISRRLRTAKTDKAVQIHVVRTPRLNKMHKRRTHAVPHVRITVFHSHVNKRLQTRQLMLQPCRHKVLNRAERPSRNPILSKGRLCYSIVTATY